MSDPGLFRTSAAPASPKEEQPEPADTDPRDQIRHNYQEKELLRLFVENTPAAVAMCDRQMRYLVYSRRWVRDYNLGDDDLVGKCHYDVFQTIPEMWKEEHRRCFQGEIIEKDEEEFRRADGTIDWVRRMVHPWLTRDGTIGGLIMFTEVVTEKKKMALEREALIAELESRNAELEQFTYTVSHDLKSPLITIKGFIGFVEKSAARGDMARVREDLGRIAAAADNMKQLLDELLELSRIGRVLNPAEEMSFAELIRQVLRSLSMRLNGRKIKVVTRNCDEVLFGDRLRLQEVLENLIDNAAKFTSRKTAAKIEIGTRRDADDIVYYVKDNGSGIEPRYLEKVFGLFERLDTNIEGTGIALAIVKRIIDVHGGRIWAESEGKDCGTTVCFTLPQGAESKPA